MRFPCIRSVEQTEQIFRRIRDCPKEQKKKNDIGSRLGLKQFKARTA